MDLTRLTTILRRNRQAGDAAIVSLCSAHPLAIRAGLELARDRGQLALIEATSNQVNQYGGYTGLSPADFAGQVTASARELGLAADALVLGGDHLGPQPWRDLPADEAMAKAIELVRAFAEAGFGKIHLDCSMPCADDADILSDAVIAERSALLAQAVEATGARPLFVIGTEVPAPGGMGNGHRITPTAPRSVLETWRAHRDAFVARGLALAFERVIALVAQPGLDFGNEEIVNFDPQRARALSGALEDIPGLVFEAHSTDYQRPQAYRELVSLHFAVLKVGPAATFAMREALYALESIEAELVPSPGRSRLRAMVEATMLMRPGPWESHYTGDSEHQAYLRHFSYSDRIRYYWPAPEVEAARVRLFENLAETGLPLPLISQYLPQHYDAVASGSLAPDPNALVLANIRRALLPYSEAAGAH